MREFLRRLRTRGVRWGPLDVFYGGLKEEELDAAEDTFFSGLQLSNGTFKTTGAHRLDDVNEIITPFLARRGFLRINDVAASSGRATAEWSDQLRAHGIPHRMIAGDLFPEGVLVAAGTRMAILWDGDGYPLAVQCGRRAVYLSWDRKLTKLARRPLEILFAGGRCGQRAREDRRPERGRVAVIRVPLVTRRLSGSEIRVVPDDIFNAESFRGEFDVCRAANILHRDYFSEPVLRDLASNLAGRLREGGVLVVCRTADDGSNRMTAFGKREGELHLLCRLHGGSDIESLVLGQQGAGPGRSAPLV